MSFHAKLLLAHIPVNPCFPKWFITNFHGSFYLSSRNTYKIVATFFAFHYYTALIEKTQYSLAVSLLKLRHTQLFSLYFLIPLFRYQMFHTLTFFGLRWIVQAILLANQACRYLCLSINKRTQVYTFLTAHPIYPKDWKFGS